MTRHPELVLPFGQFYGTTHVRRDLTGVSCAVMDADPHRVVERHSHEGAHFVLVLDGLYVSSAQGAPAVSHAPLLVFNPAGTTHCDRFDARAGTFSGRFMTVSIANALLADEAQLRGAPKYATVVHDPTILNDAFALARAVPSTTASTLERESLAYALFDALRAESYRPASGVLAAAPRWLHRATELLNDNASAPLSIHDIANIAGVHPVHLARVFRQCIGCTPAAYQRQRRIERASTLLRYSARAIADIALTCGFVDQSHLTTTFRRVMGCTPAQWRRAG
ncbi:MAG: helix-turn-helix transcriptional regulator [Gemmatimonadaceae bacterium]|nr:helix-turn-helix transcriptional regulator [Gemmatimonadaceae bacterium]